MCDSDDDCCCCYTYSWRNEIVSWRLSLVTRLTDKGTNFKQVLTNARREQALLYLSDPAIELKEVAYLLGYEEQNSFYRAFRLWEGDTPSN
jgi:AraC-like DNA-binding protein